MGAFIYQSIDHSSKSEQTFIDQTGLGGPFVFCATPLNIFTACQIDQIQLPGAYKVFPFLGCSFNVSCDRENSMAPRTQIIAVGGRHLASVTSFLEQLNTRRCRIDV
jgi:hypothetical protein